MLALIVTMSVQVSNEDDTMVVLYEKFRKSLALKSVVLSVYKRTGVGFVGKLKFKNITTDFGFDSFGSDAFYTVGDAQNEIYVRSGVSISNIVFLGVVERIESILKQMNSESEQQSLSDVTAVQLPSIAGQDSFASIFVRLLNIVSGEEKLDAETILLIKDMVKYLQKHK